MHEDWQLHRSLEGCVAMLSVTSSYLFEVDCVTISVSREVLCLLARHYKLIELFRAEYHLLQAYDVCVQLIQVLLEQTLPFIIAI